MKYEDYENKRKQLMDEAEKALDAGRTKEAEEKMNAVRKLDSEWDAIDNAAKKLANFRALNCEPNNSVPDFMKGNQNCITMQTGSYYGSLSERKEENKYMLGKEEKMYDRIMMDRKGEDIVFNQPGALGNVIRGMVTGKWENIELRNAVTTTATGTLIPEIISSKVIDKSRSVSLFALAGVPIIPMDTNNVTISRVKNDPAFTFKAEGEEGSAVNFKLEGVKLESKTCYGYAYVSLESIKSSLNLDDILYNVFANAIAQAIDKGMLYGQYNASTSSYEKFAPTGIMNDDDINVIAAKTSGGYDDFIRAFGKIRNENGDPTIVGINSNTEEILSLLKATDGQYLTPPKAYEETTKIVSNQLKHDDSAGDDALVFDPKAMVIGLQNNIQIKIIEDGECLKKGLVGFQIYSMLDCKAVTPKHICKITGIK